MNRRDPVIWAFIAALLVVVAVMFALAIGYPR